MGVCASAGCHSAAAEAFAERRRVPGLRPPGRTLSTLAMRSFLAGGRAAEAVAVLDSRGDAMALDAQYCNAALDALVALREHERAREVLLIAMDGRLGAFGRFYRSDRPRKVDTHGLSPGAALTAVRWWLEAGLGEEDLAEGGECRIVTGHGLRRASTRKGHRVKDAVQEWLGEQGLPLAPTANRGMVALDGAAVRRWREARAAGAPPPEEEGRGESGARA